MKIDHRCPKIIFHLQLRGLTSTSVAPSDKNGNAISIKTHLDKLSIQDSSAMPTLSEIKIAFLLKCRKTHPLCGGDPGDYERLKYSYAAVAAHVANGKIENFHPGETATELYYNTQEVQELRKCWTAIIVVILCTLFLLLHILWNYISYQKQVEALGENRHHIAADTMRPWWHDENKYEKSVKRLFIEQWMTSRGDAQRQQLSNQGKYIAAGRVEGAPLSIIDPSAEHIAELRMKIDRIKAA
ncbi:heat shock protein DnaJ domain-containing protein [Perkinsela sp. CCAP 1560/4]|nr:heat shock protein DnaJ domain-containing protein [Perkinsela sp. CCAP 1560/4]|eukprot:KNH06714.1 heat shock protein DnaJ domain-containing protein [Perkinsela sp. CCAP 1560/4]